MLAEILSPTDFFLDTTIEARIDSVFEKMQKDAALAGSTPSAEDWQETPVKVRLLAAILYEQVVKEDLLGRAKILDISFSES